MKGEKTMKKIPWFISYIFTYSDGRTGSGHHFIYNYSKKVTYDVIQSFIKEIERYYSEKNPSYPMKDIVITFFTKIDASKEK